MGKLKKTSPGTYSTTGTKPGDWGVDPLKPYSAPKGGTIRVTDLHKQAKKKKSGPNNVNIA